MLFFNSRQRFPAAFKERLNRAEAKLAIRSTLRCKRQQGIRLPDPEGRKGRTYMGTGPDPFVEEPMAGRKSTWKPDDAFDIAWKGILEPYFRAFVRLAMPIIHARIDWQRGYEFCDGELRAAAQHGGKGGKAVDRLVKVWLLSGEQQYLYIHIEVQCQSDPDFPRRMWVYFFLLDVKLEGRVASMAVLGDDDPNWRPDSYSFERWGNSGTFRFPVFKLLDLQGRYDDLLVSDNIIEVAIAAHLKALATRRKMRSRKEWKTAILKTLLEQGRTREEIRNLFRFIDLVMPLPEVLKAEFEAEVEEMEREKGMPFLSYFEQDAMKRGRREGERSGLQRGRKQDILEALELRFQAVPEEVRSAVASVRDARRLSALYRQAILCHSLEEFQDSLKTQSPGTRRAARTPEPSAVV